MSGGILSTEVYESSIVFNVRMTLPPTIEEVRRCQLSLEGTGTAGELFAVRDEAGQDLARGGVSTSTGDHGLFGRLIFRVNHDTRIVRVSWLGIHTEVELNGR
jgi:hypothetical protein